MTSNIFGFLLGNSAGDSKIISTSQGRLCNACHTFSFFNRTPPYFLFSKHTKKLLESSTHELKHFAGFRVQS